MRIDLGSFVVFILFEIPLLISSWFLIKIIHVRLRKFRLIKNNDNDKMAAYFKLSILLIIQLLVSMLAIYVFLMAFVPKIHYIIPYYLRLIIMLILLTTCGSFFAILIGLKDVVRAGGSSTQMIREISSYLCEYFDIDQKKKDNKKRIIDSDKKA